MPTMKLHSVPFRDMSPRPTKIAAITTSTISATTSPVVPVMNCLPKASENCVAPRPRKKAQLLPATKRTEFTSDRPAIQMNQLAPDLTSCACFAISVTAGGGPVGPGGGVLGGPDVLIKNPLRQILLGPTVAQNQATSSPDRRSSFSARRHRATARRASSSLRRGLTRRFIATGYHPLDRIQEPAEFTELLLPAHDRHLLPVLAVHGTGRQSHPHARRLRVDLPR